MFLVLIEAGYPMDSEAEALEEKLTSLLGQLRAECAILERVVYKNKNQHRRSSYFQYLMKVYKNFYTLFMIMNSFM